MIKRRSLSAMLLGCIIGCSQLVGSRPSTGSPLALSAGDGGRPAVHVVLIAIDGTRWQEIFRGTDAALADTAGLTERQSARELVPNIEGLGTGGIALGDDDQPLEASGPNYISLPGYTEILTGRPSNCQENDCEIRPDHTIADSFREAGAALDEVAVITSWDRIDNAATHDPSSILISAGRTHGRTRDLLKDDATLGPLLDAGEKAPPDPGHDDYRPDQYTTALATAFLRERRPRFMFIALGDTDEYGHNGDYAGYLGALRRADAMVGDVVSIANEWKARGEDTLIMVTTDHGREDHFRSHGRAHPESARTWLVGKGGGLSSLAIRRGARHHLADIAPTIELATRIAPRTDGDVNVSLVAFSGGVVNERSQALAEDRWPTAY